MNLEQTSGPEHQDPITPELANASFGAESRESASSNHSYLDHAKHALGFLLRGQHGAHALNQINRSDSGVGCFTLFAIFAAATGAWSLLTGRHESAESCRPYFPLPERLVVKSTSLPHQTEVVKATLNGTDGKPVTIEQTINYIEPANIDFSTDFELETDRYKIVKHSDWIATRWIGHIASIPTKIFFWDSRCGWGLDADGTKNVIGMLERDKTVNGITVRINHNQVFEDAGRALGSPRAIERNSFLPRLFVGSLETLAGEFCSELRRGDYYNPMTGTVVIYSDVPAIYAHEVGHHKDFARFSSDWFYASVGRLPGVVLYPEWKASSRAANELLPPELHWQFWRYLIPAYSTYVLYTGLAFLRLAGKEKSETV